MVFIHFWGWGGVRGVFLCVRVVFFLFLAFFFVVENVKLNVYYLFKIERPL